MTLQEMFEACEDEYIKFELIENPPCKRPDLCAFLLLDKLVPGDRDMVSASEHDEFYLSVNCDELAKVATLEDVRYLVRCGVMFSGEYDCLSMFA